ncbi:MAG: hypothetical protein HZB26_06175 [Candidatus Hydrogenedentes bacterium]|nr:hypothetical protein [Candidatus Hydrogenedentota bacterium]
MLTALVWAGVIHGMLMAVPADENSAAAFPEVDALPELKDLPDLFLMRDGTRVTSREDWGKRRRELIELLLHYEYGHMPPAPGDVVAEEVVEHAALDGKAISRELTLAMGPEPRFRMKVGVLLPATGGPRFPVVIAIDPVWQAHVVPTARQVIARGYAFAGMWYFDADDDKGTRTQGVYPHYPDYDWGTLAAWAWGCMRLTDYLCTLPEIDSAHMAVTGHSRTGKAALLAGALDERFALVAPHASGTGGAGALRIADKDCETLEAITDPKRFYYWFHPRLRTFAGKETRLPIDQHFVKALVAPRAFLSLEARGDQWSNPLGMQATHKATETVFQFLGAGEKIALHERPGGHDMVPEDWEALLDFADHVFFGKALTGTYNNWPYPGVK